MTCSLKFLYDFIFRMRNIFVFIALVSCAVAEEVRLVDLDPNEAQQLINSQDQTLKYAPKIESNVPAVRYLGNEPHHVQEDIYLAKQYHGQDGLGGYLYGYQVPDISKNEKKEASGPLRGAYNYINGDGKEVKVEYWDNGDGFHQVDNVPEIAPKQVEDSPDVAAAKQEFFKRWNEEAERNQHPIVDPNANVSPYSGGHQGIPQSQYQNQPTGGSQYFSNPSPLQSQVVGAATFKTQQSVPYGQGQQQQHYPQQTQYNGYQPGPVTPARTQLTYSPAQSQSGASGFQAQQNYKPVQQNTPVATGIQYQGSSGQQSYSPGQGQQNHGYLGSTNQLLHPQNAYGSQPNPSHSGVQGKYQPAPQNVGFSGSKNYQPSPNQIDNNGEYSESKNYFAQTPQNQGKYVNGENPEENGPPKGFFYSFDYPVGIIVQKGERALPAGGESRSIRDVYEQNKAHFEAQLQNGKSSGTQASYLYVKH